MAKPITKIEALERTKRMLVKEWSLDEEPDNNTSLRDWPDGLGQNDDQIAALEGPIEKRDFKDVKANADADALVKAETVLELRDAIYEGIPDVQSSN